MKARPYLIAVSAAGLATLAAVAALGDWQPAGEARTEVALFGLFVLLGELAPIRVARRRHLDEITISTTFAFALLLAFGPAPAIVVYAGASVVGDVVNRSRWPLVVFNAAQYTLSLGAAAAVLATLGAIPYAAHSVAADIPVVLLAAAVYFAANTVLAGALAGLLQGQRVLGYLRRDLAFQTGTAAFLLTLAPIVVASADASLALLPLLLGPMLAIYLGARQSMINEYRASHDVLTDLPNRSLLQDRLEHDAALARRDGSVVAVMLIDLDDFKDVNDTLGHHHGDLLLRGIGPRLGGVLRETDTLARLGGDEFAIVAPQLSGMPAAFALAKRVIHALESPFVVEGVTLDVRASIGIACFPAHGDDIDELLQRADVAMYRAKDAKTGCEAYDPDEDNHSRERLTLVAQLRRAIDHGELVVHYQPKVTLADGRVDGAEALVRWRHPELGLIGPDRFLPLAEHTGLINPLTAHVLDTAAVQCGTWRGMGIDLRMAVNLSPRSLLDPDLVRTLRRLLASCDLPAEAIQLEITESAVMADTRRAVAVLDELRSMGIGLAIDDFGTGYSSLSQLKELPVDEIKVDKSFVLNMGENGDDSAIVHSTIELGHNLGLKTTAEGVESEDTRRQLADWGCDFAQGFYFGRPISAAELTDEMIGVAA